MTASPAVRRQLGTNFHLDAFRPWLTPARPERHLPEIARRGLRHVRIVGEPLLPDPDGGHVSDPDDLFARLVDLCRGHGLTALTLCWNVVHDAAAAATPLLDATGAAYPRGHWGLFNFSDPGLREVSLRSLSAIMAELRTAPDVFRDFQPTNEWLLAVYPPHGWSWPAYSGEMTRVVARQVMYDRHSLDRWARFLAELPEPWRQQVAAEGEGSDAADVPPPDLDGEPAFSATRLAWARFRSALIGDYLVDVYRRLKPEAGDLRLLSQSAMPIPLTHPGPRWAGLGHNPEYWLKRGRSCDVLAANTYDSYDELQAYPGHGDRRLDQLAWLLYFRELVRAYDLDDLVLSEQGANSYFHTEDVQRYLVMRGALAGASVDLDLHTHLLWNDEPGFEPVHEQFFGIVRDQHLQPKVAAHELDRVRWVLERADPAARRPDPQVMIVLPRESMDLGLEAWTADTLTGPWHHVAGVTTDTLLAERGVAAGTRAVVFAGRHDVSSAATLAGAARAASRVVACVTAARFGTDEDQAREDAWRALTGLADRPPEARLSDVEATWLACDGLPEVAAPLRGEHLAAELHVRDLPAGARALCVVGGGEQVLAYELGSAVLTTLPVGRVSDEVDPDLTRWTSTLIERCVSRGLVLPFEVTEGAELTFHVVGDVLTVTNPGPSRRRATVAFDQGRSRAAVDVAAGSFSAVQLSGSPRFAVLSGPGAVVVNGTTVVDSDVAAAVLVDPSVVQVQPVFSSTGERVTQVHVNGRPAQVDTASGQDVWVAPAPGSAPVTVRADVRALARSRARYERVVPVVPDAWPAGAQDKPSIVDAVPPASPPGLHTLVAAPDSAWLEWRGDRAPGARIGVRYRWWSALGTGEGEHAYELDLSAPAGTVAVQLPVEYPALVECTADAPGRGVEVRLVYRAVDTLDALTTRLSDRHVRVRFLHPMRRQGFDIVDAAADVLDDEDGGEVWRPARLTIGHRGMHVRHLQWAEDWVDVTAPDRRHAAQEGDAL